MDTTEILKNIAQRCGGDIYLGVVGPVRVGKSTFIREFMEKAVIPYVNDEYEKARMIDELPQAGMGKTIMTTEPKFVPNTAASITFDDGFMSFQKQKAIRMRMVCVWCVRHGVKNLYHFMKLQKQEHKRLFRITLQLESW